MGWTKSESVPQVARKGGRREKFRWNEQGKKLTSQSTRRNGYQQKGDRPNPKTNAKVVDWDLGSVWKGLTKDAERGKRRKSFYCGIKKKQKRDVLSTQQNGPRKPGNVTGGGGGNKKKQKKDRLYGITNTKKEEGKKKGRRGKT